MSLDPQALEQQLADLAVAGGEAFEVLARLAEVVMPKGPPRPGAPAARPSTGTGLEERVRRSETRLRALVDQIPAVVFVAALAEDENEVYVSPQIETLLGFSQEEWLGNPLLWYSQLHPDDHDVVIEAFTRGVQTGGPFRAEVRFFARDGRQVWIHGEAQLIRDEHGQPEYFQGVGFDITPSKEAQEVVNRAERERAETARARAASLAQTNEQLLALNEQLRVATALAEEAAAARSTFLATMSHELRTPMNSVIVLACLLADTDLSAEQRGMLRSLELSADHLLSLINDILDFSRLRAGKVDLHQRTFDLQAWLEDTLEMVAPRAAEKYLGLRYALEGPVPLRVTADDGRLRQVLLNLLGNAVKFTHAGEVLVTVRARPAEDGRTWFECAVSDTGIGIAPDRLGVLFDEFSQAEGGITREFGGTGLGLAISRSLIELMGGDLTVTSQRGVGSVFTFGWEAAAEATAGGRAAGEPALAGRLLVFDDRRADGDLVARLARSCGLSVAVTARADEALAWLRAGERFDLAVVGHNTSGTTGLAVARSLSAAHTGRPLPILISAYAVHGPALRGDGFAFAGLLPKPLRQSSLWRSLAEVLVSGTLRTPGPVAAAWSEDAGPLRILVAEDNDMNQEVATLLLRAMGHEPVIVATGQQAVDAVAAEAYDLVLMDMWMPGMDGLTATRRIRALGDAVHQPAIVALTANALPGDRETCLEAGMDAYLPKPIDRRELAGVLVSLGRGTPPPAAGPTKAPGPPAGGDHDDRVLDRLRKDYGEVATHHLVGMFRQGAPGMVSELVAARAAGDADAVHRIAHTLKSSARMLGASSLADACERMESATFSGSVAGTEDDAAALAGRLDATLAWLESAGIGRSD